MWVVRVVPTAMYSWPSSPDLSSEKSPSLLDFRLRSQVVHIESVVKATTSFSRPYSMRNRYISDLVPLVIVANMTGLKRLPMTPLTCWPVLP